MSKKRILVVDYEPKSLDRLLSMISTDRYDVQTAKDGMAAIEEFDAFHPDLVLLRTMLPKKHGFQVCQEIVGKSGSKPVPVVMHCSIYKGKKYQSDAIKIYGASEYLDAPVESGVLQDVLERYLGDKALQGTPLISAELPAPPNGPPAAATQPAVASGAKTSAATRSSSSIDRALEETLSGLNVMGGAKKKTEAPKPATPVAQAVLVAPNAVAPPLPVPPTGSPKAEPVTPAEIGLTSEDLFGDVIQSFSPTMPMAPPDKPLQAPAVVSEVPKPAVVATSQKPFPERPKPTQPAPPDLSKDLLQQLGGEADPGAKKAAAAKSRKEMDRRLEETLSGIRLTSKPESAAPTVPVAPKVALPTIELPKVEAPKVLAPQIELPEISLPKAAAPEVPEVKSPKSEAAPPPSPATPKTEPKLPDAPPPAVAEAPKKEPQASDVADTPKEKGIPFGNYLLMEKIAVGGMAELFKAKQRGLEGFQRIVAIKRILPHLAANDEFVTMFIDEAKLAAQLKHPNIVHIYDLGRLEDSYFIAMELVEGMDLRSILRTLDDRGATLPPKAVVFIAHQIAAALQYAHTARDADGRKMHLVHRDVSPQNILLSGTGEVKLVDFGIAKAASKASHTQSGALKGKLLYMSPEQAYGQVTDARTDIFSLAAVTFEMITGGKLFGGDSEMSILEKVREARLPDFSTLGEKIPAGLQRILWRALEKDLNRRYNDCKAFQLDLEKFARQEWRAVPGPYQAVCFLSEYFPEVYKKETVQFLAHDEPKHEDAPVMETKVEAPAPPPQPPKPIPAPDNRLSKSQRGKSGQSGKRFVPPKPIETKAPEAKPQPEPATVREKPKVEPLKSQAVVPVQKAPPAKADSIFSGVAEVQEPKSKKGLVIGLVAAAVVIAVVAVFMLRGPGKPTEPPQTPEGNGAQPSQPVIDPAVQPTPPPVLAPPEPVQPAPGATAALASEAELKAARERASRAVRAFDASITAAEGAGAAKYSAEALASLKSSKGNIDGLFRRAKTVEEFDAAAQTAEQGVGLANTVKDQSLSAAKAAEEKASGEAAAAVEAKRLADEAERKKAAAATAAAAPQGTKAGDFVEVFQLDVKPKELQPIQVENTILARRNRLQGQFYLEVAVDEKGSVTAAKILKGPTPDYGMNDALIQAAKAMRYTPGIKDGVPVKTKVTLSVRCKVE